MLFSTLYLLSTTALGAFAAPVADASDPEPQVTQGFLDQFIFNDSMEEFQKARNATDPSYLIWDSDGCSIPILQDLDPEVANNPDGFPFLQSCERHDFCYRNYGKYGFCGHHNEARCNSNFEKDMGNVCDSQPTDKLKSKCNTWKRIYYNGVKIGGATAFCTKQKTSTADKVKNWFESAFARF